MLQLIKNIKGGKMKSKLLVVSILAVFILLVISVVSVVGYNTSKPIRKESPLFGIRTRRVVKERIDEVIDNIKTKYVGERVFLLPFQWLRKQGEFSLRQQLVEKSTFCQVTTCSMTFGT